jgi:hypothetical protein
MQLQSPALSLMGISTGDRRATQQPSFGDPLATRNSALGSPMSVSTIIGPTTSQTSQSDLAPPSDIITDDPDTVHYQPPDASFEQFSSGTFSASNGGAISSRTPPFNLGTQNPQYGYIGTLLAISTTCALKFYHSLLPRPSVSVNVHQNYAKAYTSFDKLQFAMKMEYHPRPTAILCAEALSAARAFDATLSLPELLDLISHITAGGLETCEPEHLPLRSEHAARMAELWQHTTCLLRLLDVTAQGVRLDLWAAYYAFDAARKFCQHLEDEKGIRHAIDTWNRMRTTVLG